jgi:hypothetical protein
MGSTAVARGEGLPAWQAAVKATSDKSKSPYRLIFRFIGYLISSDVTPGATH